MRGGTACQTLQTVPPLEDGDDAAEASCLGNAHQFVGDPAEIVILQVETRQGIQIMCIEAGRNDDEFRIEILQRRQYFGFHPRPEERRVAAPGQGDVDDIIGHAGLG